MLVACFQIQFLFVIQGVIGSPYVPVAFWGFLPICSRTFLLKSETLSVTPIRVSWPLAGAVSIPIPTPMPTPMSSSPTIEMQKQG